MLSSRFSTVYMYCMMQSTSELNGNTSQCLFSISWKALPRAFLLYVLSSVTETIQRPFSRIRVPSWWFPTCFSFYFSAPSSSSGPPDADLLVSLTFLPSGVSSVLSSAYLGSLGSQHLPSPASMIFLPAFMVFSCLLTVSGGVCFCN